MNFARLFVMSKSFGDEGAEFFLHLLAIDKSIPQRDERHRNLSGIRVRTADNSAFFHCWMFQKDRFDLGWRDGETLVLDHFLAPVDHAVETFAIAGDDVAGPEPSIAQHGGG